MFDYPFDPNLTGHPGVKVHVIDQGISASTAMRLADSAERDYMSRRGVRFIPAQRRKWIIRSAERRRRLGAELLRSLSI